VDGNGSAGSTPDSGPNSPPINLVGGTSQSGSGGGTPQHEDGSGSGGSPYGNSTYGSNGPCDLTLYSSPSLPNISLGKPIPTNSVKQVLSRYVNSKDNSLKTKKIINQNHQNILFIYRKTNCPQYQRLKPDPHY